MGRGKRRGGLGWAEAAGAGWAAPVGERERERGQPRWWAGLEGSSPGPGGPARQGWPGSLGCREAARVGGVVGPGSGSRGRLVLVS